jgi:hypothetical protein
MQRGIADRFKHPCIRSFGHAFDCRDTAGRSWAGCHGWCTGSDSDRATFSAMDRSGRIVGSRHHPDTTGDDLPVVPDGAHPVEDIGSLQILPSLIVTHTCTRHGNSVSGSSDRIGCRQSRSYRSRPRCRDIDPAPVLNRRQPAPRRPGSRCGPDHPVPVDIASTDPRSVVSDPLHWIGSVWACPEFLPRRSATAMVQDIGPVAKNHGPYHRKQIQLGKGIARKHCTQPTRRRRW